MDIEIPITNLNELARVIYRINMANEWQVPDKEDWYDEDNDNIIPQKLVLIHSEVSEALEWYRQVGKEGYKLDDRIYTYDELKKKFDDLFMLDVPLGEDTDNEMGKGEHEEWYPFDIFVHRGLPYYKDKDIKHEFGLDLVDIIVRVLSLAKGLDIDMDKLMAEKLEVNKKRGIRHGGKKI